MNCAIGIDLGGTDIKYALVKEDGTVLYESLRPTQAETNRERILNNLKEAAGEALRFADKKEQKVIGMGIGTPGIVDDGKVLGGAENLKDWENLPLGKILEQHLDLPVFVENDANVLGLAEARYGTAKGSKDVIFLTIGTGVGGAMILNGRLYGGYGNRGGELGHIIVDPDGEKCPCGAIGCLEAQGSVMALIRDYKRLLPGSGTQNHENIDGRFIVNKYHEQESAAINAMNRHFDYLGMGVASYINIFSPQKVIIGGGITESGEFYIENIRNRALRIALKETSVHTVISRASLGTAAGTMGAASLVFDNL